MFTATTEMKLYTKTGDDGSTGLFGGGRVRKDHARIEAYGTVDEANAVIGLAAVACGTRECTELAGVLVTIQGRLFDLGADLATPHGASHENRVRRVGEANVTELERWIDQFDGANAPLRTFVLPGGTEAAARLHVARTVVRRAERAVLRLAADEGVGDFAVPMLNRLSDLLFAMARAANRLSGVDDVPWNP